MERELDRKRKEGNQEIAEESWGNESIDNQEIHKENRDNESNGERIHDDHEERPGNESKDTVTLNIPYAGEDGEKIMKKMKKVVNNSLDKTKNTNIRIVYKAKKLSARFSVKDKTELKHIHNVVYHIKCLHERCKSHYIGQTKCRTEKRTIQHNRIDKNSHVLK